MSLFHIEQSRWVYRADLVFYSAVSLVLAAALLGFGPRDHWALLLGLAAAGLASWSLAEYLLHRFVLHGVRPFSAWHAAHHKQPLALMGTPTVLSATLIALLVFVPAWWAGGLWVGSAFTWGLSTGYLGYGLMHHALHQPRSRFAWLRRRQLWHARHHGARHGPAHFGVTSAVWDHVFRSHQPEPCPP